MDVYLNSEIWVALITLTFLEVILGIDNIVFISMITGKLPQQNRAKVRNTGLVLALISRIALLLGLVHLIGITKPLFTVFNLQITVHDLILLIGGLFLIYKSTAEIHNKIRGEKEEENCVSEKSSSFWAIVLHIVLFDNIFSFDSILTAIGLTQHVWIMITAAVISMSLLICFSGKIADFINAHPNLQILALAFLILIGFTLVLEALNYHIPKGYIYFAVVFSLGVEFVNMKIRKRMLNLILNRKGPFNQALHSFRKKKKSTPK
ncbi:TerC family protein [Sediminitomix flava]|uniref:Putative tellurium resistance membrane protein TerC n=1 Tax=Sediminitomix flava TaxID=379075 RepID=A0A315ZJ38_SEDFL|nr:TerC family protein [Sediminitomix flava]PWJ33669.1 putative tellurium resistance membrane protein TerC [Sediminitomix flava]